MPSLKKSLLYLITSQGEVSLDQCHELAESLNKKQSNCERTLRILVEKGNIKKIINYKGHVTGYFI